VGFLLLMPLTYVRLETAGIRRRSLPTYSNLLKDTDFHSCSVPPAVSKVMLSLRCSFAFIGSLFVLFNEPIKTQVVPAPTSPLLLNTLNFSTSSVKSLAKSILCNMCNYCAMPFKL